MPQLVFPTSGYIRAMGLKKPWPDPKVLETAGVNLKIWTPDWMPGRTYFKLERLNPPFPMSGWWIDVISGRVVNLHLPAGSGTDSPFEVVTWEKDWLHWIEVSQEIAVTFDEPINLSSLGLERINSKDIIDTKIPKNYIPPR